MRRSISFALKYDFQELFAEALASLIGRILLVWILAALAHAGMVFLLTGITSWHFLYAGPVMSILLGLASLMNGLWFILVIPLALVHLCVCFLFIAREESRYEVPFLLTLPILLYLPLVVVYLEDPEFRGVLGFVISITSLAVMIWAWRKRKWDPSRF